MKPYRAYGGRKCCGPRWEDAEQAANFPMLVGKGVGLAIVSPGPCSEVVHGTVSCYLPSKGKEAWPRD